MFRLSAVFLGGAALALSLSTALAAAPLPAEILERAAEALEAELTELNLAPRADGRPADEAPTAFKLADEASWGILLELQDAEVFVPPQAQMVLQLMPPPGLAGSRPGAEEYRAGIASLRQSATQTQSSNQSPSTPRPAGVATASDNTSEVIAFSAVAVALLGLAIGCGALWRGRRHDHLASIACTDGLTGLMNRRQFDLDVYSAAERNKDCTAALMIDVDHFKNFNDTYGHACGDDVLRKVSSAIDANLRRGDVAYRYGGEEFSVLLPGTDNVNAEIVAERVRRAIEMIPLDFDTRVTASVGVASGTSARLATVVVAADDAMYSAKSAGRNRTVVEGNNPSQIHAIS
jgi:diguanylate cyclase (GGDEF)-like protein